MGGHGRASFVGVIAEGYILVVPEHLFRGDGTGAAGGSVTPVRSVGGRVRGVMMGRAGRPLDDGVTRAGRAVIAAVLAAMMPARGDVLEVLGLVAATGAATQVVRTAAGTTQEVCPGGTAAPLQLLQLGTVVLRAAGHASAGDRLLLGHTCRTSEHAIAISAKSTTAEDTRISRRKSLDSFQLPRASRFSNGKTLIREIKNSFN